MHAQPNTQRLVDQFIAMASIASPSRQEGRLAAYLKPELEALGFVVEFDSAGEQAGGDTGNLIATLPATAAGVEPMIFCCHLDTVTPCADVHPRIADGVVRSDGTTILGGDDKAGIAAIVEGVQRIRERGVAHGPIQVLLTICEEIGMHGAKELDYESITAKKKELGIPEDAVSCHTAMVEGYALEGHIPASPSRRPFGPKFEGILFWKPF